MHLHTCICMYLHFPVGGTQQQKWREREREKKKQGPSDIKLKGRIPETTLQCIQYLRRQQASRAAEAATSSPPTPMPKCTISVEIEKPGREGLAELAAEADVIFYSRSWAEVSFPTVPVSFLRTSPCGLFHAWAHVVPLVLLFPLVRNKRRMLRGADGLTMPCPCQPNLVDECCASLLLTCLY